MNFYLINYYNETETSRSLSSCRFRLEALALMRPEAHCKSTNAPAKSNWRKKDKKQNDERVKTPHQKRSSSKTQRETAQKKKYQKKNNNKIWHKIFQVEEILR